MKALRFRLIGLPGRVVSHARKLIIRLGGGAEELATSSTRVKGSGRWRGTGRMSPNRALPSVDLISRGVPWRGDDAPRPRQASPTRPGCTQSSPNSPCVSTNIRR